MVNFIDRLKSNYMREVESYLKNLKSRGFIINEENEILHYTEDGFKKVDNLTDYIYNGVENYYDFNSDDVILNLAEDIFPLITNKEIKDYEKYNLMKDNVIASKDMKKELNEIQNTCKAMVNNNPNLINKEDPYLQCNILNKNCVVYESSPTSKGYYMFEKSKDRFIRKNYEEIAELLEIELNFKLKSKMQISTYMRKEYQKMLLNTDFPTRWNKNKDTQDKLNMMKENHDKVNKIVKSFI